MRILFMCVANSARSQLAEGLARAMAPADFQIESAGSEPTHVNPLALRTLAELDVQAQGARSKALKELDASFIEQLNYVVTLCAEEVCPYLSGGAVRLHWPLPDPAGVQGEEERLQAFRDTARELQKRLQAWLPTLGVSAY